MNKSLYEFCYIYNSTMIKKNTIQSDLVSVVLGFNYFLLNIYINTFKHSYIYIKILQIQCKYNTINILINKLIPERFL